MQKARPSLWAIVAMLTAPVAWLHLRAIHWSQTPPVSIEFLVPVMMLLSYTIVLRLVPLERLSLRLLVTILLIGLQWIALYVFVVRWPPQH
ncbi:MAG: hypothetical protein JNG89_13975 [Planctomycetaceae bacterium]|nr:hypothetical protein [Planctomycetaceae bacterium]